MFHPTHVADIRTSTGTRRVALRRTHTDGALEVFRDITGREFHQWADSGILEWTQYQIRRLRAGERVPDSFCVPGVMRRRDDAYQRAG